MRHAGFKSALGFKALRVALRISPIYVESWPGSTENGLHIGFPGLISSGTPTCKRKRQVSDDLFSLPGHELNVNVCGTWIFYHQHADRVSTQKKDVLVRSWYSVADNWRYMTTMVTHRWKTAGRGIWSGHRGPIN